jgi:hypothetical protein
MRFRLAARAKKEASGSAIEPPPSGQSSAGGGVNAQLIRRNKALVVGLAAVILSSGVSWAAASRIRSPAEIAARTAPPKPSLISVPVEKRVLSSDVVVRGTVRYGAPQAVLLPTSALRKGNPILTTAPVKGKELSEGSVAFTVSGRPAFVFQGAQPSYRDMGPGATGEDVRQLEEALARHGLNPGSVDGVYDSRTGLAVAAWYLKAGWSPFGPTEEQLQALRSVQAEWFTAQSDLLGAREALTVAQHDLTIAQQKAAAAARALLPSTPLVPATVPGSAEAAAAQARADQERVAAAVRVTGAKRALERATEDERAAQARMEEARSRRPPPSNEEYAELAKESRDASNKVAAARDELTAAQDALTAAQQDRGPAGGTHDPGVTATLDPNQAKLDAATTKAEADRAADNVAFARQKVGLMGKRAGSGPNAAQLGIQVPAGEILFFANLPLRVDDVKLRAGDEVLGPVMTATSSRLVIESALSPSDAKLVRDGAAVAIHAPDVNIDGTGTVSQVAATPGTNGVDPQRFYMEVVPNGLDVSLAGASVVQTIGVESTQGEVLAVPVAALSVAADGSSRVQVQGRNTAAPRYVTVTPGLSAKGLVAVTPVEGTLAPGDLVVVGANGAGRPGSKGAKRPAGGSSGK